MGKQRKVTRRKGEKHPYKQAQTIRVSTNLVQPKLTASLQTAKLPEPGTFAYCHLAGKQV